MSSTQAYQVPIKAIAPGQYRSGPPLRRMIRMVPAANATAATAADFIIQDRNEYGMTTNRWTALKPIKAVIWGVSGARLQVDIIGFGDDNSNVVFVDYGDGCQRSKLHIQWPATTDNYSSTQLTSNLMTFAAGTVQIIDLYCELNASI